MNEIEIKIRISKEEIIDKLISLGCVLSNPVKQEDYIFAPKEMKGFNTKAGDIIIRIRVKNKKNILTLKQKKVKNIDSKEIEFEVSSFKKAKDFIEMMGYVEEVRVVKTRISTKYKEFNICIDDVEKLGEFAEVEIMTKDNDKTDYYENEIMKFINSLNIKYERIDKKYDTMMYELENNKEM